MKNIISQIIRQDIVSMPAYTVHSANNMIKLDAMENPFSIPQDIQQQLAVHLSSLNLNRYPSPELYRESISTIRSYASIDDELEILLGNGSDEIINMLANILPNDATILAPNPSFIMYQISAKFSRLNFVEVDLLSDFNLDISAIKEAIKLHKPSLIYLAYPNNPTGNCFYPQDIQEIIELATHSLIIIDEAYHAFTGGKTYITDLKNIIKTYPNVLVMRTLSKIGLAGLRLGYITGHKDIIQQLDKIRPPYNLDILSQQAVQFLLQHGEIFKQQAQIICQQRTKMQQSLANFGEVFPSEANFLLIRTYKEAKYIYNFLQQNNILVKNVSNMHKNLSNCLRISIGTEQENTILLNTLQNS